LRADAERGTRRCGGEAASVGGLGLNLLILSLNNFSLCYHLIEVLQGYSAFFSTTAGCVRGRESGCIL
jgi:hypothetical protein